MLSSKFLTFFYNQFLHSNENILILLGILLTMISFKHKFHFLSSSSNTKINVKIIFLNFCKVRTFQTFLWTKNCLFGDMQKKTFLCFHIHLFIDLSFIVFMSYFFISLCRIFKGAFLYQTYFDLIFVTVYLIYFFT